MPFAKLKAIISLDKNMPTCQAFSHPFKSEEGKVISPEAECQQRAAHCQSGPRDSTIDHSASYTPVSVKRVMEMETEDCKCWLEAAHLCQVVQAVCKSNIKTWKQECEPKLESCTTLCPLCRHTCTARSMRTGQENDDTAVLSGSGL